MLRRMSARVPALLPLSALLSGAARAGADGQYARDLGLRGEWAVGDMAVGGSRTSIASRRG